MSFQYPIQFFSLNPLIVMPILTCFQQPMSPQRAKRNYLAGLDALRAVAALSVCLFHYTNGMLPKLVVPTTKLLFSNGYLGVDIFFVISGFIIPYSLVGKNYRVSGIFPYLKNRIFRINPPAYASIFLVLAQWFFIDKVLNHNNHYLGVLSWGMLVNNFLFTIPFTHYSWINGIFWTLAIEFQFYLFIGILFKVLFTRSLAWFAGIYLLTAALSFLPNTQRIAFLHYSPLFALGGLSLLWQQGRLPKAAYWLGLLALWALTAWQLSVYAALIGVGTALAINELKVSIPGLSFLGKISYSLYLVHGIIGTTAEVVLIRLMPPTYAGQKILLTACTLPLAIGGAYIFYRVIEQPFMRLAAQARR